MVVREYHIEYITKEGEFVKKTEVFPDIDEAYYSIPRKATDIYIESGEIVVEKSELDLHTDYWFDYSSIW